MDNDFAGLLFPSDWLRLSQDVLKHLPSNPWDNPPNLNELDEEIRAIVITTF